MIKCNQILRVVKQDVIFHFSLGADKRPHRARVNGRPQFWKREPERFCLPMKFGLTHTFQLTPKNADEWFLTEAEAKRCKGKHSNQ